MKRHCDLCQHQNLSLKKGTICNLTKEKPNFKISCNKIALNYRLKNKLKDILINYEDLKQSQNKLYFNNVFYLILGFFIIISGYFLWRYFLNQNYDYSLYYVKFVLFMPLIFLSVGFVIVNHSLNQITFHKKNLIRIKESKESIDEVLKLYHKKYTYSINFKEEIYGVKEGRIDIKFF